MPSITQQKGFRSEALAARWLESKGYQVLEYNYRFKKSEIDLIVTKQQKTPGRAPEIVFVEVKWRQSASVYQPILAVSSAKRKNLLLGAKAYLLKNNLFNAPCRFDIICLTGPLRKVEIEHFESAFRDR